MTQRRSEIRGLEPLKRKLGPGHLTDDPLVNKVLRPASENAKRVAAKGVGGTAARSMMSEVRPTTAKVFSLMSDARVTSIETGRPPGDPPLHTDALRRWARRVGYFGSLYALASRIARRGVKGRFFMRAAVRSTDAMLPRLVKGMAVQVERKFGER